MNINSAVFFTIGIIAIFFVISYWLYSFVVKKGLIPVVYDVYTGKKKKTLFYEFTRTFFFLMLAISCLLIGNITLFIILIVISCIQFILYYLKMKEETKTKEIFLVKYSQEEQKEWSQYLLEKFEGKIKNKPRKKIMLIEDTLYFSNKKKILLHDKMYRYIFINKIEVEERIITFSYGFMGIPLWKEIMYIPKERKSEIREFLKKINDVKSNKNNIFFQKNKK